MTAPRSGYEGLDTGSIETMPFIHWKEKVRAQVRCSDEAMEPYRARLQAAYNNGEHVWMMAGELKLRLEGAARAERAERDGPRDLRRIMAQAYVGRGGSGKRRHARRPSLAATIKALEKLTR